MDPSPFDTAIKGGMPLQVLWEDGERVFSRASCAEPGGNRRTVLVVAPASDNPTGLCLQRLAHEFSLKEELDASWAARPLDLVRERGRTLLLLEDHDATPLRGLLGAPMALPVFLGLAQEMAAALRGLHGRGLVHKDINPENILVDGLAGQVWLTGFGIASRLPRERQIPSSPEFIAGTLAYMAPEQTGRMNRSIDSRSDLYALGVTFYEMLTGSLPFNASDPMEWVHCHIARSPTPPDQRLAAIPAPLSQIVMKLLAKTAEERYQTAAGVEHDLRRCRAEWESHGSIGAFALAAEDATDRLQIPERLYGRSAEVATLLGAFEEVVAGGAPQFVLVSGHSGIGKSSVVHELHKALVPPRGLFASGKFDQYKRDIPYATLAQAFQSLVRQIFGKNEAELATWREALHEALGANGRLIVDLIPELELVIGRQPPVADLAPQDAQRRFQAVLQRFIGVFASARHPLALFLDDLQWLDGGTLDLLEDILTQGDIGHLLLIGAYRDNEVSPAHPLMRRLDAIRRAGATVREITLAPLDQGDLGQLIAESVRCETRLAEPLVRLVHEKTGGNPFFAIQFLHVLADESLLVFDHGEARWFCDLGRIRAKRYTDNVADLMVVKLARSPAATQGTLRQLACVGSSATFALLATVCQISQQDLHDRLWEAVRGGLVLRSEHGYAFQHDRIQEAAYSLIPADERAEAHLRIGRLLMTDTSPDKREEAIFEIVSQFNRSAALIAAPGEREQVASLNLAAGKRARNAAAYSSALTYFAEGRKLLAEDCWTLQYRLAFELEFHQAECELLTGELKEAEERLSMLTLRAETLIDLAAVTCLRVDLYTILSQPRRAVDIGCEFLRRVGFDLSANPGDEEVRREYERIWQRLGTRTIEDLFDLPFMDDPGKRATIDVLNKMTVSSMYLNENFNQIVLMHMVNFSIEHGNCAASCVGYARLGRALATRFADYSTSRRFGELSLRLVDNPRLAAFRARVYFIFGVGINSWTQHLRFGKAYLDRASEEANKNGDLPYIGYCWNDIVGNLLSSGKYLPVVDREATNCLKFARKTGSRIVESYIFGQLRLIRSLRGLPFEFQDGAGELFEANTANQRLSADVALAADLDWFRRMQTFVFEEDYPSALNAAARSRNLLSTTGPDFERAEYHFFAALARAGTVRAVDGAQTEEGIAHTDALRGHHRQLQVWATNCPDNFENMACLVGAELARIENRELESMRLYEQAIHSARANGFVHNEALACERAAQFYAARGFEDIAAMYLARAREGYRRWGADGKVRQLEARHPQLAAADAPAETAEPTAADPQLDVAAVVKASQALSSEMLLPRLVERLMTIALQNAGADRGLLILRDQNDYRIEAEARADGEGIALRFGASDGPPAPETLIRFVMRTEESVILNDAAKPHLFSEDPYLLLRRPRSVFCLPLVRQGAVAGLLYLENSLAPQVFTPERARLLELLASQAAISLQNAALYADLELQVGLLHRLPVSAWTLKPDGTPDFVNQVWLEFSGQTLDYVRSHPEAWMTAVHPEDREAAAKSFREGVRLGQDFAFETRSLGARDGTYRRHLQQAVVLRDAEGKVLKFVGTTTDIDDQKRTEEALRQTQADLAHVARVATLNAMGVSIAHDVSQPLSGILTNANTGLRMLTADPPNLAGAAETARRTIRDANRASDIVSRLRTMFSKSAPTVGPIDLNDAAREVIALAAGELQKGRALVQTEFAEDLPVVNADRVQLQQVILNLVLNAAEAMAEVEDRPRKLVVETSLDEGGGVKLSVRDSGVGVDQSTVEKLFQAFYTTKANGMGVGLSICRSIIQSHAGRLWVEANPGSGATFSFSIPAPTDAAPRAAERLDEPS